MHLLFLRFVLHALPTACFFISLPQYFLYLLSKSSGVKRPGLEADQEPSSVSRFKMRGSTPPSSHIPSWHDALLITYRNVFDFQAKHF